MLKQESNRPDVPRTSRAEFCVTPSRHRFAVTQALAHSHGCIDFEQTYSHILRNRHASTRRSVGYLWMHISAHNVSTTTAGSKMEEHSRCSSTTMNKDQTCMGSRYMLQQTVWMNSRGYHLPKQHASPHANSVYAITSKSQLNFNTFNKPPNQQHLTIGQFCSADSVHRSPSTTPKTSNSPTRSLTPHCHSTLI